MWKHVFLDLIFLYFLDKKDYLLPIWTRYLNTLMWVARRAMQLKSHKAVGLLLAKQYKQPNMHCPGYQRPPKENTRL